jgi:hypothetical protein
MRQFIAFVLVVGTVTTAMGSQAPAAGKPSISACSLLPTELVVKVGGINPKMVPYIKPSEEAMGATGSACEYGEIRLQVDPFQPARLGDILKTKTAKSWVPVSGVGDAAYFHNNSDNYAELIVRAGTHVLMIQFGVAVGSTAEATKPNTITLANAIIPKLR